MKEKLIFIDVETTGLDPKRHEVIEVAACVYDRDPLNWQIKNWKLHPSPGALLHAEKEALAVNGYNPSTWAITHEDRTEALLEVFEFVQNGKLVGHNGEFDCRFLKSSLAGTLDVHHHVMDTKSLAWPYYAAGFIEDTSLSTCVKYFFGKEVKAEFHGAVTDVYWTMRLYQHLVGRV